MDLHTAGHRRGVVAAPHGAAVEAGRAILAEGGNAIEAMVAMAAVIAVVYPHMNQLGGDGFWLIREPSGRIRAVKGRAVYDSRAWQSTSKPLAAAVWAMPLPSILAPSAKETRCGFTRTSPRSRRGPKSRSCWKHTSRMR